jgi:hypothetical protein
MAFWAAIVGLVAAVAQGVATAQAWKASTALSPAFIGAAAQVAFIALLAVVLFLIAVTGRARPGDGQ